MGHIRHHAIIVTGINTEVSNKGITEAHQKAQELFPFVTPITPRAINSYSSFMIPPDGSKEGWGSSNEADELRAEFVEYLKSQAYEDGSSPLSWVEVSYADDYAHYGAEIIHDSGETFRDYIRKEGLDV